MGGYIPRGGTYMAYHVGRILYEQSGRECVIVRTGQESIGNSVFDYPCAFDTVDVNALPKCIGKDDILVINPSFSNAMMGCKVPGKKLMYVQDFKTYQVIDGFCDYYVSVSNCVSQFLKLVYNLDTPVIPAFIRQDLIAVPRPWHDRPPNSVFAVGKLHFQEFLQVFVATMQRRHPDLRVHVTTVGVLPHAELLQRMMSCRYLLSLSACEGFGLLPLEGMACGCTVTAFSACGGKDYMRQGVNCEYTDYPDFEGLADHLAGLLREPERAAGIAAQAIVDSRKYDLRAFEQHWIDFLESSTLT
jgi:hypothetical protein